MINTCRFLVKYWDTTPVPEQPRATHHWTDPYGTSPQDTVGFSATHPNVFSSPSNTAINWIHLSKTLPIRFIDKHMYMPWNIWTLSHRSDLPEWFVKKHMDRDWCATWLSRNSNISIQFILSYPKASWDWRSILQRKDICPDEIEQIHKYLLETGVRMSSFLLQPRDPSDDIDLTLDDECPSDEAIQSFLTTLRTYNRSRRRISNWITISAYPWITPKIVGANLDLPWDRNVLSVRFHHAAIVRYNIPTAINALSRNTTLSHDAILRGGLNYQILSANKAVTPELIEANPSVPWCMYKGVWMNPNLTEAFIEKHLVNRKFDDVHIMEAAWYYVSKNPCVKMSLINKNAHWPWNIRGICMNPNLDSDFIDEHFSILRPYVKEISENLMENSENYLYAEEDSRARALKRTRIILAELMFHTWNPDKPSNLWKIIDRAKWILQEHADALLTL